MKKVLFVCSGNTCRSPMAEGIAKEVLTPESGVEIEVSSAGTGAIEGLPASGFAVEVAKDRNINISGHVSRSLDRRRIQESDLIVAMERTHRNAVGAIDPSALDYTYVITDFCEGVDGGVPDPIGGALEEYRRTFELLWECIGEMRRRLVEFDGWKKT